MVDLFSNLIMAYNVFPNWIPLTVISMTNDIQFANSTFAQTIDFENLLGLNIIQIPNILDEFYKLLSYINIHISNLMQHPWAPNLIALLSILVTISIIPIKGRFDRINKTRSFSSLVLREIKRNQEKSSGPLSKFWQFNELSELNYRNMIEQGFGAYLKTETQERLSILYGAIIIYNRTVRQFNQIKDNMIFQHDYDKLSRISVINERYNEVINVLKSELEKYYSYSIADLEDEEKDAYSFFPYLYRVSIFSKKILIIKDIDILLYRFYYLIKKRNDLT